MSLLKIWWLAARPKTLPAAMGPVILGTALAYERHLMNIPYALLCLVCTLLLQIGANLANDYFDGIKGTDTNERKGPLRVMQAGLVNSRQMITAMILVFGIASLLGLLLIIRGGWPILWIGLTSILCAVLYTAGPFPLAYLGLGDIFVFIFFGLIAVSGTAYVQTLSWSWTALLMGAVPGLLSVAILTVNNLRDVDEDKKHHKRTLAVRFGKPFAQIEYSVAILAASLSPIAYFWRHPNHPNLLIVALICMVMTRPLLRKIVTYEKPEELNPLLGKTGQLLFVYSILFGIAII